MNSQVLDNYDLVIFDCDGVLIDVNLLKCEAFGKAVEGYSSDIVVNFVDYCKKTFGVSRYIKFKEFFSEFAKEPFQEDKYQLFLNKYSMLCKEAYSTAHITPGCENLLMKLSNSNKRLFVASGSDEQELIEVFDRRDLNKYFNGIYGSPKTKSENTSIILSNNPNKSGVFIGDAFSDMKTAKEYNLDFIYMSEYTVQSKEQDQLCKDEAILTIKTLRELFK